QVSGQPCTSNSGGPSPPMTACRRSPSASTYRLPKMLVNPTGRFGAPEIEAGPSAMDIEAELELMRISPPYENAGWDEWGGSLPASRAVHPPRVRRNMVAGRRLVRDSALPRRRAAGTVHIRLSRKPRLGRRATLGRLPPLRPAHGLV